MAENLAKKQLELEDILYDSERILNRSENADQIFEIRDTQKSLGFVTLNDLKSYLLSTPNDLSDYQLRPNGQSDWRKVYDYPSFQRRKLNIIHTESLNRDLHFYLLMQGQKTGPFNFDQVKSKMDQKEILVTDLISTNDGHTWMKVYQIEGLDRRELKMSEHLPHLPHEDIFTNEEHLAYQNQKINDTEMDAITGLAYLSNLKRGKAEEEVREEHLENALSKEVKNSYRFKIFFAFTLIGLVYVGMHLKATLEKTPIDPEAKNLEGPSETQEQIKMNRPKGPQFNVQNFAPIRPTRFKKDRFGKNFSNSVKVVEATKDNHESDAVNANESYYYNDNAPMELDPVRSQVSKETAEGNANSINDPTPVPANDPLFNQEIDN